MNRAKKEPPSSSQLLIGIVGPCASGKSTLIDGLNRLGYHTRHIAQEHSYVPNMWKRITNPDFLVYLHASYETCTQRRKLNWTNEDYLEQLRRLLHARDHADLMIETDFLTPAEVLSKLIEYLKVK